jgi:hypothetical protein
MNTLSLKLLILLSYSLFKVQPNNKGKDFYLAPDTFKTQGQQTIQNKKCIVKPEKSIKTAKDEVMPWE